MSIVTATGDQGQTSLFSGERVWKDDLRVEAYGCLDELDAHVADARHLVQNSRVREILEQIQNQLGRVMGQLASRSAAFPKAITTADVQEVSSLIRSLEEKTPLHGLVIIGSLPASAKLDICRTIARRAERRIVSLARAESVAEELLQYVNRLSDLFFILARGLEAAEGAIRYKQ